MKSMSYSGPIEVIAVGLEPGEKILASLRAVIEEFDIRNGAIVSGIAAARNCSLHYIQHTRIPSDNAYYTLEEPLEVGAISGIIADGEPHLHTVVGKFSEKAYVGHMEEDTEVAYVAELCILKFNGMNLCRHVDEKRQIGLLAPKDGAGKK